MDYFAAALTGVPGVGARRLRALLTCFQSAEQVWRATEKELYASHTLPESVIQKLISYRRKTDIARIQEDMRRVGVQCVTCVESNYPMLLGQTNNPPAVLFYKGNLPEGNRIVSIVGSRKATPYGVNVSYRLAKELAAHGVTIVSGGARGIDRAAHKGALASGGATIVVAASGLDYVYPQENRKLFKAVCEHGGAVVSEYPLGVRPCGRQFPARNRIIAGMSCGVIVVEAAERSGSLITSDFALEEGRDVFAVPGSIFSSLSKGTNRLLRKGAICVTCSVEILQEYNWGITEIPQPGHADVLEPDEEWVYRFCSTGSMVTEEEILEQSGFSIPRLKLLLVKLQCKGKIREVRNGVFVAI